MSAGDKDVEHYLREISQFHLLSAEEEQTLARQIAEGDTNARETMIRSNLRLVVSISKQYSNQGLPLLDLIAEGNLGLLKAVECYRADEGTRFSTYGSWWIKQSIRRALKTKVKNVRVPAYMSDMVNRWRRVSRELTQDLKRTVSPDEIAETMRLSPEKISLIQQAIEAGASSSFGAGGEFYGEEGDPNDIEEVLARAGKGVEPDHFFARDQEKKLALMLECLNPRERRVVRMRYGMETDEFNTLQEIGKKIHLTRERVRQIEGTALTKLLRILDEGE